jgi:PAS domain S-box-containing protein
MPFSRPDFDLRPLLNGCPLAVVVLDSSGRIVSASGGLLAEHGWSEADLIGRTIESTLTPGARPAAVMVGVRRSARYRTRLRAVDGRSIEVEDEVSTLPAGGRSSWEVHILRRQGPEPTSSTASGASDSSIGISPDARVRAHHMRLLLDHLPVGIAYFHETGEFLAGNLAARRLMGRSPGSSASRVAPPQELAASLRRCVEDRVTAVEKGVAWNIDGETRHYDWRLQPLGSPDSDRAPGVLAVFVDVTERVRGELGLRQAVHAAEGASRRKSQFLSAISHDLRTPVNTINIQVELLRTLLELGSGTTEEILDGVRTLGKAVGNLNELLHDLLDLSRFDAGRVEDRPQNFALDEWLDSVVAPHEAAAAAKGLDFTWRLGGPIRHVRCDRVKLTRVISNLVENAVKFTERGSVDVSARLSSDESQLLLRVVDTGVGIPTDQFQRIFDEFAQLNNPARDRSRGTGLGLAICRRLVEGAGGSISLDSRVGQGTVFQVRYPVQVVPPPESATTERRPTPAAAGGPPLLIIEDDPLGRRSLAVFLAQTGHAVAAVASGPEALRWLGDERAALIVLDLHLPGMAGLDVLRQLRALPSGRDVPIVVLTAETGDGHTADLQALDVEALLQKPVDLGELVETIGRLLERPHAPTRE